MKKLPSSVAIDTERIERIKILFCLKYTTNGKRRCWIWTGSHGGRDKRAMFTYRPSYKRDVTEAAGRVQWRITYGWYSVPPGLCVLHSCDNKSCVNPSHLFLGMHDDNNKDRAKKGRSADSSGIKNGHAKLTVHDVRSIRNLYPEHSMRMIATWYGIHVTQVHNIIRRKQWASVD